MEINITCGQYANDHYSKLNKGIFLPFNEAMNKGNILYPNGMNLRKYFS